MHDSQTDPQTDPEFADALLRKGDGRKLAIAAAIVHDSQTDPEFAHTDNVAQLGGKRIAIEAKFVDKWGRSLRNPGSAIGDKQFALAEQATMLLQARKYSAAFDEVIYHSNSPDLIGFYEDLFKQHGLGNVRFIFTP